MTKPWTTRPRPWNSERRPRLTGVWLAGIVLLVGAAIAWAATPSTPVGVNNVPLFTASNPGVISGTVSTGAGAVVGNGTAATAQRVTLASDSTGIVASVTAITNALPAGTNVIGGVLNSIGTTPTDRTIASTSGASQTMAAALTTRKSLIIQNTGTANCGVNPTGGTAAIGAAGTLTLVPNGSYQPRIPTLSAITVICTAGQPIYAEES